MTKIERLKMFMMEHKAGYREDMFEYIIDNCETALDEDAACDILLQLYSKFGMLEQEKDLYLASFKNIERLYGTDRNIIDVGCGVYPRFAELIDEAQTSKKVGTITAYDPLLAITKMGNVKLHKTNFGMDTKVPSDALITGIAPCEATIDIIKKANATGSEFYIALCGCTHFDSPIIPMTYKRWVNMVYDVADETKEPTSKIYVDYYDDEVGYPYPIIRKECI